MHMAHRRSAAENHPGSATSAHCKCNLIVSAAYKRTNKILVSTLLSGILLTGISRATHNLLFLVTFGIKPLMISFS